MEKKTGVSPAGYANPLTLPGLDGVTRFLQENARLLFYVLAVSGLAYATELFEFSLHIDSENHAYYPGPQGAWVSQGRWGMYLVNALLLPDPVMPFMPMLIALLGSSIGAVYFLHALSDRRGVPDYLAAPVVVICPLVYFAFYFTTLGYGAGIAFLLAGAGIYALTRWNMKGYLTAVLCFCFGIGIYQAVLPLLATMFCLQLVAATLEDSSFTAGVFMRRCAMFLAVLVAGYGLYALVNRLTLDYMDVQFDSGYILGFVAAFQWGPEYLLSAFQKTLLAAANYYTGGKSAYIDELPALNALFFLTLAATLIRVVSTEKSFGLKVLALLALLAAVVAPMLMHMLNNGHMPPRTVFGVSHVMAALIFFACGVRNRPVQLLVFVLAVSCMFRFAVINNRYAFANSMVWQADRELSLAILQRVHAVLHKLPPKPDPYVQYPMEIVGWHEYQPSQIFINREVIGASFYTWGAGDVNRIERLFRTMGEFEYRAATEAERLTLVEHAMTMPSWPQADSVDVINGIIVIKLREYNPNQIMMMCLPAMEQHPVCQKYRQ